MKFIQIINSKKFILVSTFLFFYIIFNFLDGERGLISYHDKLNIKKQLTKEKSYLVSKLALVEKKNYLLTSTVDLDYLEMLYRKKFMVGKSNEQIYKID